MGCFLRARGVAFDVDRFLAGGSLKAFWLGRLGEPRFPLSQPKGRVLEASGINVAVADKDCFDLERLAAEATAFLALNRAEVARLVSFQGVERVSLDFGIDWRDVAVQTDCLPPELVKRAGELGLWIQISHYPGSEEVASEPRPSEP